MTRDNLSEEGFTYQGQSKESESGTPQRASEESSGTRELDPGRCSASCPGAAISFQGFAQDVRDYRASLRSLPARLETACGTADLPDRRPQAGSLRRVALGKGHISSRSSSRYFVRQYPLGVQVQHVTGVKAGKSRSRGIRGKIEGFSKGSGRRLRRSLMEWFMPASETFDCTLTIPGPVVTPSEVRRVWHTFLCRIRKFPVAGHWRIELQTRGQAHFHLFGYSTNPKNVIAWIRWEWMESVDVLGICEHVTESATKITTQRGLRSGLMGASMYCCHGRVKSSIGWLAYMTAHMGKSKEDQLGWRGRQWGRFNTTIMERHHVSGRALSPAAYWRVVRTLRRWKDRPGHYGRSGIWQMWMEPELQKKVLDWACNVKGLLIKKGIQT